jgi:hypothetical protein
MFDAAGPRVHQPEPDYELARLGRRDVADDIADQPPAVFLYECAVRLVSPLCRSYI